MICNFSLAHYKEILEGFLTYNYTSVSFPDFQVGKSHQLILRHDIDMFPDFALNLADIESSLNYHSTFHFLLTSDIYNMASLYNQQILDRLRTKGHKIGLHVDPIMLEAGVHSTEEAQSKFYHLFGAATTILGELDSYSFHRPATTGFKTAFFPENLSFKTPPCAYESQFMQDIPYYSDSRREWKQGCICKKIGALNGQSLQLLIHPLWWTHSLLDRNEVLENNKRIQQEKEEIYHENNLSFYKKI